MCTTVGGSHAVARSSFAKRSGLNELINSVSPVSLVGGGERRHKQNWIAYTHETFAITDTDSGHQTNFLKRQVGCKDEAVHAES